MVTDQSGRMEAMAIMSEKWMGRMEQKRVILCSPPFTLPVHSQPRSHGGMSPKTLHICGRRTGGEASC